MILLTFILLIVVYLALVSIVLFFLGVGILGSVIYSIAAALKYHFPVLGSLSLACILLLSLITLIPVVTVCIAGLFVLRKIFK